MVHKQNNNLGLAKIKIARKQHLQSKPKYTWRVQITRFSKLTSQYALEVLMILIDFMF